MIERLLEACLLAQDAAQGKAPPAGGGGGDGSFLTLLPLMIGIFLLFQFMVLGPQRREQKKHEAMLTALKKDDKVLTRGGIIGSVANISPDGQKITIKVDDAVRIPIHRQYIVSVLTEEPTKDADAAK
jgi:preprotein translocase subunit YajC